MRQSQRRSWTLIKQLGLVAAVMVTGAGPAWAGGGEMFTDEEQPMAGHPYVGYVKDRSGNGIADAKITVVIKGGTLIMRTDDDGRFHTNGFGVSLTPDDVQFSCSKDGYKQFALSKQVTSDSATAPVEVDCILEPQ